MEFQLKIYNCFIKWLKERRKEQNISLLDGENLILLSLYGEALRIEFGTMNKLTYNLCFTSTMYFLYNESCLFIFIPNNCIYIAYPAIVLISKFNNHTYMKGDDFFPSLLSLDQSFGKTSSF